MPHTLVCLSQVQDARSLIPHLVSYSYVFNMCTNLIQFLNPPQCQCLPFVTHSLLSAKSPTYSLFYAEFHNLALDNLAPACLS